MKCPANSNFPFRAVTFFVSLVAGYIVFSQDLKALIPTLGIFGVAALRIMPSANQFSSSMIQLRSMSHSISVLYDDMRTLKKQKWINKTQIKNFFVNIKFSLTA